MTSANPISALHKSIALPGRRKVTLVAELGRGSVAVAYRGILESDSFVRRPVVVSRSRRSSRWGARRSGPGTWFIRTWCRPTSWRCSIDDTRS